jgi:hypothetical protein
MGAREWKREAVCVLQTGKMPIPHRHTGSSRKTAAAADAGLGLGFPSLVDWWLRVSRRPSSEPSDLDSMRPRRRGITEADAAWRRWRVQMTRGACRYYLGSVYMHPVHGYLLREWKVEGERGETL